MSMNVDQLIRVAWQYYIEDCTQQEIAERFNLSRSKVARLLKEARDQGIVEFQINGLPIETLELEKHLREDFGLKDAVLIPSLPNREENRRELGKAAATYLQGIFQPNFIVGLGMGRTLAEIPSFFEAQPDGNCSFVEMVGGASRTDAGLDTYNVSWLMADRCGGVAIHINSPVIVKNQETRNMLMSDPQIISSLNTAAKSDIAIVGIGPVCEEMTLAQQGYCDENAVRELMQDGAVCDIIGHYIDLDGNPVENCIEERLVCLTCEQLAAIPMVIAVAGGKEKAEAILGAIRSGLIHVLVSDSETIESMLEIAESKK